MTLPVQLIRLHDDIPAPAYGTPHSAGLDLMAAIDEPITIQPGEASVLIPTGIKAFVNDPNWGLFIFPRSGMGHKRGLVLGNSTGVIDADYQGELMVSVCVRPGHEPITINRCDRIAQLVALPVGRIEWVLTDAFTTTTERSEGGFGSTGR